MSETLAKETKNLQAMLDESKKGVAELTRAVDEQVKKVEQMTRESPGTALALTFVAGLAIGGILALAARRKD